MNFKLSALSLQVLNCMCMQQTHYNSSPSCKYVVYSIYRGWWLWDCVSRSLQKWRSGCENIQQARIWALHPQTPQTGIAENCWFSALTKFTAIIFASLSIFRFSAGVGGVGSPPSPQPGGSSGSRFGSSGPGDGACSARLPGLPVWTRERQSEPKAAAQNRPAGGRWTQVDSSGWWCDNSWSLPHSSLFFFFRVNRGFEQVVHHFPKMFGNSPQMS